jgi:hypothetical protein
MADELLTYQNSSFPKGLVDGGTDTDLFARHDACVEWRFSSAVQTAESVRTLRDEDKGLVLKKTNPISSVVYPVA